MKILFNGCSYTWGDEIKDNSKRFSDLIGGINISECGRSNDGISRTTIEWFKENDCVAFDLELVIIQWTVISRMEVFNKNNRYKSILNNNSISEKHWKYWYKYCYNVQFGIDNLFKNVFLLKNYLESRGIKYLFLYHDCWFDDLFLSSPWKDFIPNHIIRGHAHHTGTILPHISACPECYMPNEHPSEKGHKLIADYIKHHANIF
jgi:hypothetical protein